MDKASDLKYGDIRSLPNDVLSKLLPVFSEDDYNSLEDSERGEFEIALEKALKGNDQELISWIKTRELTKNMLLLALNTPPEESTNEFFEIERSNYFMDSELEKIDFKKLEDVFNEACYNYSTIKVKPILQYLSEKNVSWEFLKRMALLYVHNLLESRYYEKATTLIEYFELSESQIKPIVFQVLSKQGNVVPFNNSTNILGIKSIREVEEDVRFQDLEDFLGIQLLKRAFERKIFTGEKNEKVRIDPKVRQLYLWMALHKKDAIAISTVKDYLDEGAQIESAMKAYMELAHISAVYPGYKPDRDYIKRTYNLSDEQCRQLHIRGIFEVSRRPAIYNDITEMCKEYNITKDDIIKYAQVNDLDSHSLMSKIGDYVKE